MHISRIFLIQNMPIHGSLISRGPLEGGDLNEIARKSRKSRKGGRTSRSPGDVSSISIKSRKHYEIPRKDGRVFKKSYMQPDQGLDFLDIELGPSGCVVWWPPA